MTIPSPLSRPPRQARSRATSDAIVAAGLALLAERDFATVTIAEVVDRAGVSIGGFYARFRGKEALLHALAEEVLGDCADGFEAALNSRRMAGAPLARVIRAYVRVMIAKFREHRAAIIQIRRHAGAGDAHQARLVAAFNQRVHGRLRALLAERRSQIRHPDPDLAANIGLFMVSAAAREAVLAGAIRAYLISIDDAGLVEELTRAYLAYLTATPARARGKR